MQETYRRSCDTHQEHELEECTRDTVARVMIGHTEWHRRLLHQLILLYLISVYDCNLVLQHINVYIPILNPCLVQLGTIAVDSALSPDITVPPLTATSYFLWIVYFKFAPMDLWAISMYTIAYYLYHSPLLVFECIVSLKIEEIHQDMLR